MHDPCTHAFDINLKLPEKLRSAKWLPNFLRFNIPILTIWHRDPEKDGSDNSCGWFMRGRHCDQIKLKEVASQFRFQWSSGVPDGWFDKDGDPNYSCQAITVGMFLLAANIHFGHWSPKSKRFLRDHCYEILHFAENSCDSLYTFIEQPFGKDDHATVESRSNEAAQIVYSWVCRAARPWWKHPKWHIHHWELQFHPWQRLKRKYWDRCSICGKRGFGDQAACGNWDGDKIWHQSCGKDSVVDFNQPLKSDQPMGNDQSMGEVNGKD